MFVLYVIYDYKMENIKNKQQYKANICLQGDFF